MKNAIRSGNVVAASENSMRPCRVRVSGRISWVVVLVIIALGAIGVVAYSLLTKPGADAQVKYYKATRCLLAGTAPVFADSDALSADEVEQLDGYRSYYRVHSRKGRVVRVERFVVLKDKETLLSFSLVYSYDRKGRVTRVEEVYHNLSRRMRGLDERLRRGHTAFLRTVSVDKHDSAGRAGEVTLRDRIVEDTTTVESRVRYAAYARDEDGAVTLCKVFDGNKALLGTYRFSYNQGSFSRVRLFGPHDELLTDDDRTRSWGGNPIDNAITVGATPRELIACEKLDDDLVAD